MIKFLFFLIFFGFIDPTKIF